MDPLHRRRSPDMYWTPVRIRQLRRRLALSERQLARLLGFSRETTITSLERGEYTPPASLCQQFDQLKARMERKGL